MSAFGPQSASSLSFADTVTKIASRPGPDRNTVSPRIGLRQGAAVIRPVRVPLRCAKRSITLRKIKQSKLYPAHQIVLLTLRHLATSHAHQKLSFLLRNKASLKMNRFE
jgi:hypothetical protein